MRQTRTFFVFLYTFLLTTIGTSAFAQFPQRPKSTGSIIVDSALETADKYMGLASPLLLDQKSAFKPIKHQEQLNDFNPISLSVTSNEDLNQPLPAGDYSIKVTAYCTQWSIHQPGQGIQYKLARVQGKQAKAISALLIRGTMAGISPSTLQAVSWRIQGGVPIDQWSDEDRALAHQLMPEYEDGLKKDAIDQLIDTYNKNARLFGAPPFEQALPYLGTGGRVVLQMQQARTKLVDRTAKAEHLPEMLYEPQPDGLPMKLPDATNPKPSEWAEVQKGVFARFTVVEGNLGSNLLEFRVGATAAAEGAEVATIGRLIGIGVGGVVLAPEIEAALIGYGIYKGVQALIIVTPMVANEIGNVYEQIKYERQKKDELLAKDIPLTQPLKDQSSKNGGLMAVYRVGNPNGDYWSTTNPMLDGKLDPTFKSNHGLPDSNPGRPITQGFVDLNEQGKTWIFSVSRALDGAPLNNGFYEVVVIEGQSSTVVKNQTTLLP